MTTKEDDKIVCRDPDIEMLGQKFSYPRRWQGVLVVLILSVTLIAISHIILVECRPENLKTLGIFTGNVQIGVDSIKKQHKFCFGFWTPSENTKIGLEPFLKEHPDRREGYKWQIHDGKVNDIRNKNILFGELLSIQQKISGFRRYAVVGKSSSALKEGWWWVTGVEGAYSEEFFTWFAGLYRKHWGLKEDEPIYVEVLATELKY